MAISIVEKQNVERTGQVESRGFQIAATAEAFRILSDGLYSDKVTAVLRELGTNAIDAHIEAGTLDKPFYVHLPSDSQPWLKLRDFGTGMDHDKVMNLYSTYFGTDKLDNPNVVGQLGLGSKSPLSYTRSFTVTSFKDGTKNHYVVMLNEDRLPEINHLPDQSGPSDEPNGVEIQIAVKRTDFTEFANKAANVYRYFTKRPEVCGNPNFKIADREILVEGKGWRIFQGTGAAKAIMGNIAYPIHGDKVHDITAHQRTILGTNIEIDFPIGALEFTPSRETLSYKKRTSEVLRNRLDEIISEVNVEVSKRFANCKSLWEARVLAHTMFWDVDSNLRNLQRLADIGTVTYKGNPIMGQQLHFDKIDGIEAYSFTLASKHRHYWSTSDSDIVNSKVKRHTDRKYFTPKKGIAWVEVDLPRGSYSRCEDMIRRKDAEEVNLLAFASVESRKAFCEAMGLNGDEFIKVSTLPKPAVQRGVFHQSTSQVYKHTGSTSEYRFYKFWKEAEVDLADGGVYVEMRRNKAYIDGKIIDPALIGELISNLRYVGHTITVIGVRPTVAKQFRRSDDWVDVFTYVKNLLRAQMVSNDLGKDLANSTELEGLTYLNHWKRMIANEEYLSVTPKSPLRVFLDNVKVLMESDTKVQSKDSWRKLAELANYDMKAFKSLSVKDTVNAIMANYPMIQMVLAADCYDDRVWSKSNLPKMSEYVNLVDLTNAKSVV